MKEKIKVKIEDKGMHEFILLVQADILTINKKANVAVALSAICFVCLLIIIIL